MITYCTYTGGVVAGLASDLLQARAFTSAASLILAIPSVSVKLSLMHSTYVATIYMYVNAKA